MRAVVRLCSVLVALGLGVTAAHPAMAEPEPRENRASWEEVQAPEGVATPSAIGVVNDNDVWVFGKDDKDVSVSQHWDGKTWTPVPVPNFSDLATVAAHSPDDVWIGGRNETGTKYLAHWDGKEWKVVEPGEQFASSVNDIEFVGDDVWIAGGCCGKRGWLIRWDGTRWHEHEIPAKRPGATDRGSHSAKELLYVEGLASTDSGEVIGVGMHSSPEGLSSVLIRGGKDGFTRHKPPAESGSAVLKRAGTVDGKTIYAGGYTNSGAVVLRGSGDQWQDEKVAADDCMINAMARAGTSLYASSDSDRGAGCVLRLNPDNSKWEQIPSHGLTTNSFWPSSVISGTPDGEFVWAFGSDGKGTHVKRYRP